MTTGGNSASVPRGHESARN